MNNRPNGKKPKLSEDKLTVDYDLDDFNESLPNLSKEISQPDDSSSIHLNKIEFQDEIPIDPDVDIFIRRCSTVKEAFEIINYLEKREEITIEKANECRDKLEKYGLEKFGPHIEYGYYEKKYRYNRKFHQL